MQCILMNFDDRVRVIPNAAKEQIAIGIGQMKTLDLEVGIYQFIDRSMRKTSDPLVILQEAVEQPAEVVELMDILANLDSEPYEEILRRTAQLVGQDNIDGPRPSRLELRNVLRHIALKFAGGEKPSLEIIQSAAKEIEKRRKADEERNRRSVNDDVDPDELDAALRKQNEKKARTRQDGQVLQQMPTRTISPREQADIDLGIIGGSTDELAAALNQPPQEPDPDAFDPKRAPKEPGVRKPSKHRSGSKQAKRAAAGEPKRTARSAKRSAKQTRIKA